MHIISFAPYGTISEEVGLLYLVLKYLKGTYPAIAQLRCNGVFSTCDRDAEREWRRSIDSCAKCIAESRELAQWAEIPLIELSPYLKSEVIEKTRRWAIQLDPSQFAEALYEGTGLWDLVAHSRVARSGSEEGPDLANDGASAATSVTEHATRKLLLVAARMLSASASFAEQVRPDLFIVVGGRDVLTRAALASAVSAGVPTVLFQWDLAARMIVLKYFSLAPSEARPESVAELLSTSLKREHRCGLVLEGVSTMRHEVKSWPRELLKMMDEITDFLGLASQQLPLQFTTTPRARSAVSSSAVAK